MSRNEREAGFALVVALLALLLLTFLGLTLATTTSTELRIDTNYRWSQQALYNAEAGLEVGRALLAQIGDGQLVLPEARVTPWDPDNVPNPSAGTPVPRFTTPTRNFEGRECDIWGNGAGYGAVLVDPNNAAAPFENVSQAFGERVAGNFTLWVRRELIFPGLDQAVDNPVGESLILTAEGSAPFEGAAGVGAFQRANRAVRRLESRVLITEGCRPSGPQASQTGFSGCGNLD